MTTTVKRAALLLAAVGCMLAPGRASAEVRAPLASPGELSAALDGLAGADLVVLADPNRHPPRLRLASRVAAPFSQVRTMLLDLASYRSAMPALRRLEFEKSDQARSSRPGEGLVIWELEVPLWNLDGKLWLQPTPTGVEIILMEGDFFPGTVRFSATPEPNGTTLLLMDASANLRDANWITRRMVKRSALAEPGLAAAAFYAMLRALRLQAESLGKDPDPRRQPKAMPSPPALSEIEAGRLGRLAGNLQAPALLATVRSQGNGRLALVQVLALSRLATNATLDVVGQPQTWQAMPGWRQIDPVQPPGDCSRATCWKVEAGFPFLNLGAIWKIATRPWRAVSVAGDGQGAVMGLDLFPAAASTAFVLSIYPRLEKAGYVPRKSIESEPLLEQGLALGLALVDTISLARALDARAP